MKRSTTLNIVSGVLLMAAIWLITNGTLVWGLILIAASAVAGIAAGRAMATEPRTPSRSVED